MKNLNLNPKSIAYGITFTICILLQQVTIAQMAWVDVNSALEDNLNGLPEWNRETKTDTYLDASLPNDMGEIEPNTKEMEMELEAKMIAEEIEKIRVDSFELCLNLVQFERWESARNALAHYVNNYPEPRVNYNEAVYHLGMTKMKTEDYIGAVKLFKEFLLDKDVPLELKQEVEFYHALLILDSNGDSGKKYMVKIADDYGHNFQSSAEGILSLK
jgi:hypothetical protein